MAVLPSSGALSMASIAGVMGGSAPHSLSEYYRGGGLTPSTVTITSGEFYTSETVWEVYTNEAKYYVYWGNTFIQSGPSGVTSFTSGIYTYYRGAFAQNGKGGPEYYVSRSFQQDANAGVPTSGTISIGNFYGAQK